MHPEIDKLINMALSDGQVTDKEREIILRKAEKLEIDRDEVEMYLQGFLDLNKQDNSSTFVQKTSDIVVESKTLESDISNDRKYTLKKVKKIEPAQLNKESELKLKISELSNDKKILFNNLEKLIEDIKFAQRDLVKIKSSIDKQVSLTKEEFKKNANTNLSKFINQINESVATKFGGGKLIFENPEKFIGLDFMELTRLITSEGGFNLDELQAKRKKIRLLLYFLCLTPLIYMSVILPDFEYIKYTGYKLFIGFTILVLLFMKINSLSELIKENKCNFSNADLNIIIREIRRKYSIEFDELLRLKNEIERLESIQKNLKLKDIAVYEKFMKTE